MTMSWYHTSEPIMRCDLLIGFYDITKYTQYCRAHDDEHILNLMQSYFTLTGDILVAANGLLVKTIGDAGLVAFQAEDCDQGVRAFLDVKREGDAWLTDNGMPGKAEVSLHVGPVACGMVGAAGHERFDVYGKTVNTAATLESHGFAMSQQVFRKLKPETRKMFKKHTPPVSYIPHDHAH
jgi:class 3 adenylate cyclase